MVSSFTKDTWVMVGCQKGKQVVVLVTWLGHGAGAWLPGHG